MVKTSSQELTKKKELKSDFWRIFWIAILAIVVYNITWGAYNSDYWDLDEKISDLEYQVQDLQSQVDCLNDYTSDIFSYLGKTSDLSPPFCP